MFTNVYTPAFCEVWLRLETGGHDLVVEELPKTEEIGVKPDWIEFELGEVGWDGLLSPEWHEGTSWMTWALEQGLCPYQPFLVWVGKPHYYRCGGYEYPEEWDVEYDWEVIAHEHRNAKQAVRVWHRFVASRRRLLDAEMIAGQKLRERRHHDVTAMFIRYDSYWSDYCDDMTPPDGAIVRLCSSHGGWGSAILEAWHHGGGGYQDNQAKAWEKLLTQIRVELPHLDIYVIEKLQRRY